LKVDCSCNRKLDSKISLSLNLFFSFSAHWAFFSSNAFSDIRTTFAFYFFYAVVKVLTGLKGPARYLVSISLSIAKSLTDIDADCFNVVNLVSQNVTEKVWWR